MDRQTLNKRIEEIQNEIEKLVRTLRAMENTDLSRYPENYEKLSTDAALRGELITCRLRHLIGYLNRYVLLLVSLQLPEIFIFLNSSFQKNLS